MSTSAIGTFPQVWRSALPIEALSTLPALDAAVAEERAHQDVYPPAGDVFAALRLTPPAKVRAVIIGQDPYHQRAGQAHGLAFSVPDECRPLPPSLRNIRAEFQSDLGYELPESGSLVRWAEHGVLLLNAFLTVSKGRPRSHQKFGWRPITEAIIYAVKALDGPVAFLVWGHFARDIAGQIDSTRHVVHYASHPSPLSQRGFCGTKPFSTVNEQLRDRGTPEIDWRLE